MTLVCSMCACVVWAKSRESAPPIYRAQVVNSFPHDTGAFTQGLVFSDGVLYEGTGGWGRSSLRKVELETGRVRQWRTLHPRLFGEGITIIGSRIYQLTWRAGIGIVYDKTTFRQLGWFRYAGQGWGLTNDGRHLIMSDGSSTLRFLDPHTFRVVRQLSVRCEGRRVRKLNELEYVRGEILANIWKGDYIARISPATGQVIGWIDLRHLGPRPSQRGAVLNGIAYDEQRDRLFVTGKNWPRLFEIR